MAATKRFPTYAEQSARILALIQPASMTALELQIAMNLSEKSIHNYLRKLSGSVPGAVRVVRITGYRDKGFGLRKAPLYGLGKAPDVKEPCKRDRPAPARQDIATRRDLREATKRASDAVALATSRQHTWASALGL